VSVDLNQAAEAAL